MGSSPSPSPSPSTIPPLLLLRNIITTLFIFTDKYLLPLATKFKPFHIFRSFFLSSFLFFLNLLPSFFPCLNPSSHSQTLDYPPPPPPPPIPSESEFDSGIARALTQLLSIVTNLPVNSRKYEVVRSLTDRLLDENLQAGSEALRKVNRRVLSTAFTRSLRLLDAAVWSEVGEAGEDWGLNRVLKIVRQYGTKLIIMEEPADRLFNSSAEKVAAELLWLAERMAACGCVQKAVSNWGSATRLALMALSVQPRLQGSLVKISAFLFKQAKNMKEDEEEGETERCCKMRMKMLMSWLPLLCRASNGTDAPILNVNERLEVERSLEETIEKLEGDGEQEKVLSLWLHHFTHCPSSDWPDLYSCYIRWCHASRNSLLALPTATPSPS